MQPRGTALLQTRRLRINWSELKMARHVNQWGTSTRHPALGVRLGRWLPTNYSDQTALVIKLKLSKFHLLVTAQSSRSSISCNWSTHSSKKLRLHSSYKRSAQICQTKSKWSLQRYSTIRTGDIFNARLLVICSHQQSLGSCGLSITG